MGRAEPRSTAFPIEAVMETLREAVKPLATPSVTQIAIAGDPFLVLISTVISLRTKDAVTMQASERLFALARTPAALADLPEASIAQAIYPAGFYKTKAVTIRAIARTLLDRHGGVVPNDLDALLTLKGVGRKTANLTLTLGFGSAGICVDTHVHRIVNRWGWMATRTPDATEMALRAQLPPRYWIPINDWLVAWGQNVCTPVSPRCSACALARWCARRDVGRAR